MSEILSETWPEIVLGLLVVADLIVSLTPTKTDDKIVGYLKVLVLAIKGDLNKDKKDPS